MMIYKGKKSYMVGDQGETQCMILAAAKKKFKKAEKDIVVKHGYIHDGYLYDQNPAICGSKIVLYAEVR